VSSDRLAPEQLVALISEVGTAPAGTRFRSLLPAAADPYFRLWDAATLGTRTSVRPAGFAVVLISEGAGELVGVDGRLPVSQGQVLAVPHSFGDWTVEGDAAVLVAEPGAGWPTTLAAAELR